MLDYLAGRYEKVDFEHFVAKECEKFAEQYLVDSETIYLLIMEILDEKLLWEQ